MQNSTITHSLYLQAAQGTPLDAPTYADIFSDTPTLDFSAEQINAWQRQRLATICRYARTNSHFYGTQLRDLNLDAFVSREEFATLPRTTAEDIRRAPLAFLCTSQDDIARVVTLATSGSTGKPKRIFFTQDEIDETIAFYNHGMQCLTESGDTVLALLPAPRPDSVGALLRDGLLQRSATPVLNQNPDDVALSLSLLKTHAADCVVGTAAHVLALVKLWEHSGNKDSSVKTVLLCWDASSQPIRDYIATTWNCRVHTHWGMTETGLGGAVNCAHGSGMHLRESKMYVEITDPETGAVLPDGERGEIVVTTLTRKGMPLIRYRTGDEAHILTGCCPCGSPLRRLSPSIHRIWQPPNTPDWFGYMHPSVIDGALLSIPNFLAQQAQYRVAPNRLEITVDTCGTASHLLPDCTKVLRNLVSPFRNAPEILCLQGKNSEKISIGFAKRIISVE